MMTQLDDGGHSISASANTLRGLPTSNNNSAGMDETSYDSISGAACRYCTEYISLQTMANVLSVCSSLEAYIFPDEMAQW
jgi:hypothetical protein